MVKSIRTKEFLYKRDEQAMLYLTISAADEEPALKFGYNNIYSNFLQICTKQFLFRNKKHADLFT
jgi:hypothetical protein